MKAFRCRACDNPLYFENSLCVSCGSALGFSRAERAIVPVDEQGRYVDGSGAVWWVCVNLNVSGCTWLAPLEGGQCFACDLTRTRPAEVDADYLLAEQAKRHLVVELDALGFPIRTRAEDPVGGLCFDLLASDGTDATPDVVIGHDNGVITIDLAESDPVYREKVRESLAEPYRTMLGHFRHEVGHYYEWQLVVGDLIEQARELFGDERASYADALDRHYREGPPQGWQADHLSTYATMHPFEDFAETFAHYLHICDTLDSAAEHGLIMLAPIGTFSRFRDVVTGVWMPLATALNVISRSMGKDDLYPFVIPEPVLAKLDFVAALPR
ncbi:zinc-binding metallopeptidase family protein [Nocardioides ultimimeridianus]